MFTIGNLTSFSPQLCSVTFHFPHLQRDLVVVILRPFPLEEAEPVEDEGEDGEEEEASQDGEDEDPQRDAARLPHLQRQHLNGEEVRI